MSSFDFEKQVYVKDSRIHGKGIFATARIPKDKIIMGISGDVIDGNECEKREDEENNVYIFWNGEDTYFDTSSTEKIKYINHNCDFNCDVVESDSGGLALVAYRDIETGEELTIDYGYEDIYNDCACESCSTEEELSP